MKIGVGKKDKYEPRSWWAWYPVYCTDIQSIVWLEKVIKEYIGYGNTIYVYEMYGVEK